MRMDLNVYRCNIYQYSKKLSSFFMKVEHPLDQDGVHGFHSTWQIQKSSRFTVAGLCLPIQVIQFIHWLSFGGHDILPWSILNTKAHVWHPWTQVRYHHLRKMWANVYNCLKSRNWTRITSAGQSLPSHRFLCTFSYSFSCFPTDCSLDNIHSSVSYMLNSHFKTGLWSHFNHCNHVSC